MFNSNDLQKNKQSQNDGCLWENVVEINHSNKH